METNDTFENSDGLLTQVLEDIVNSNENIEEEAPKSRITMNDVFDDLAEPDSILFSQTIFNDGLDDDVDEKDIFENVTKVGGREPSSDASNLEGVDWGAFMSDEEVFDSQLPSQLDGTNDSMLILRKTLHHFK